MLKIIVIILYYIHFNIKTLFNNFINVDYVSYFVYKRNAFVEV